MVFLLKRSWCAPLEAVGSLSYGVFVPLPAVNPKSGLRLGYWDLSCDSGSVRNSWLLNSQWVEGGRRYITTGCSLIYY